jgi:hypothetical protein
MGDIGFPSLAAAYQKAPLTLRHSHFPTLCIALLTGARLSLRPQRGKEDPRRRRQWGALSSELLEQGSRLFQRLGESVVVRRTRKGRGVHRNWLHWCFLLMQSRTFPHPRDMPSAAPMA